MSKKEVIEIMGPPLDKPDWEEADAWYYSEQPDDMSNYYQRWIFFDSGRISEIIIDFFID
ncbi:hypothetical protein P12x_005481 [Tundrisphaera lichenicola]|uniref:hypothetical protein n=1 Tax=Tundrisphaera lichenicola TaxID=2029860 RepID=UPI003EBFE453